jgi:hypothetical protein
VCWPFAHALFPSLRVRHLEDCRSAFTIIQQASRTNLHLDDRGQASTTQESYCGRPGSVRRRSSVPPPRTPRGPSTESRWRWAGRAAPIGIRLPLMVCYRWATPAPTPTPAGKRSHVLPHPLGLEQQQQHEHQQHQQPTVGGWPCCPHTVPPQHTADMVSMETGHCPPPPPLPPPPLLRMIPRTTTAVSYTDPGTGVEHCSRACSRGRLAHAYRAPVVYTHLRQDSFYSTCTCCSQTLLVCSCTHEHLQC